MKRSPVSPLNKALFERLKSQMVAPVYDHVPAGKKAPYVVLTDTAAQGWTTKTISGAEVTATIKIISEYQGDKEVAELCDRAISAIQREPLVLTDEWQVVLSNVDSHAVERLETHREATVTFKFTIIDTEE
ncbi:hypothetical protein P22_2493 [Propionispora sp. 2/2-37]|uniref:DUF3168 domain-containing protein n=1 Tax=Propionispora sp. 2/2-37 TaxID=1677858 RepID=UPI0006BB6B31|nr:DUF3168 domain-containing protein [Propionispora sp. 2/2-37]CUH96403.1 hypothetical protein P22_2493 [Propionispora sp. 2/2-37]